MLECYAIGDEYYKTPAEGFNYEIDGVFCDRCNKQISPYHISNPECSCLDCYHCGEYDSCICGEKYPIDLVEY